MKIEWPDKPKIPNERQFHRFIQKMANRIVAGHCRYGEPKRSKRYMTRMRIELEAYEKHGNAEHLYNIANYATLEYYAPEHENFHDDNTIGSVTRGKI